MTRKYKHGHAVTSGNPTPTYRAWQAMKSRCLCPQQSSFANYGGRGITVCDRWVNSFANFVDDMGIRPVGMSLDRIDNERGYELGNCRWATKTQQARNTRGNAINSLGAVLIRSFHRRGWTIYEIGSAFGVSKSQIWNVVSGSHWVGAVVDLEQLGVA